jgi:hypothetical protein
MVSNASFRVGDSAGPENVAVQPGPAQNIVSVLTHLLAMLTAAVDEFAALLAAVVASLRLTVPSGLRVTPPVLNAEFDGTLAASACAMVVGVELPL